MYACQDILDFVSEQSGVEPQKLSADTDLVDDLGVWGDDFFELMEAFVCRFNVDMSGYLWYFHHGEEPSLSPAWLLFPPPNKRVKQIPVTCAMLLESANAGRWVIDYSEHKLPKRRWDVIVGQAVGIALLLLLVSVLAIGLAHKLMH